MIRYSTLSHDGRRRLSRIKPFCASSPIRTEALIPVVRRDHESVRSQEPPVNDPVFSIEEAIRHYVDSQPPQLYRGGA